MANSRSKPHCSGKNGVYDDKLVQAHSLKKLRLQKLVKKIEELEEKIDLQNSKMKQDVEMTDEKASKAIKEDEKVITEAEQALIDELLQIQTIQTSQAMDQTNFTDMSIFDEVEAKKAHAINCMRAGPKDLDREKVMQITMRPEKNAEYLQSYLTSKMSL